MLLFVGLLIRSAEFQGSDVNAQDSELRSPLLLAAVRCGVSSIRILLQNNASLAIRDNEKHNVLHFMVMYSGSILSDLELAEICTVIGFIVFLVVIKTHG